MIAFHCSFSLFGHVAVLFIRSLFLLLFVICFFVYDCISLQFVYFVIFWVCCCLSYSSVVCFIHAIERIAFHCFYCTWVFCFGYALVFFIPLWFVLFTQSNELHFIVVFVICFVLFWVSCCLPNLSTVPFIYQFQ